VTCKAAIFKVPNGAAPKKLTPIPVTKAKKMPTYLFPCMKIIKIEFETKLGRKAKRVIWQVMFAKLGVVSGNFY
jgi:hypothetical protein